MPRGVYPRTPIADRFWGKVQKRGGDQCWEWTAGRTSAGYGAFWTGRRDILAHRMSYILAVAPVPLAMYVCHHCDNPLCVRPSHLFIGTAKDNMQDAVSKGRIATGDRNGSRIHPDRRAKGERQGASKLTEQLVCDMRVAYRAGKNQYELARDFGVHRSTAMRAVMGETWSHVHC